VAGTETYEFNWDSEVLVQFQVWPAADESKMKTYEIILTEDEFCLAVGWENASRPSA